MLKRCNLLCCFLVLAKTVIGYCVAIQFFFHSVFEEISNKLILKRVLQYYPCDKYKHIANAHSHEAQPSFATLG